MEIKQFTVANILMAKNCINQNIFYFGHVAYSWFKSYLTDRRQYVHLNDINSETRNISCGVPQGSVLCPLLFLLYINDLPNISLKLKCYLFADESEDLTKLEKTMNKELEKLQDRPCINRLPQNITKTNFVILSFL